MTNLIFPLAVLGMALVLVGIIYLLKRFNVKVIYATRPLAIILFVVSFVRYLYKKPAIYSLHGLDNAVSPFNAETLNIGQTALAVILVWFSYAAILMTVISAFYNYKTLRRMVNLFALPMLAVLLVFFETYGIATVGTEAYGISNTRLWIMAAEITVAIAIIIGNCFEDNRFEVPKSARDVGNYFAALIPAILAIMPCYVLQAFFVIKDTTLKLYDFTPEHRVMLYIAVVLPIVGYKILRGKPTEVSRMILIYASLAFLWVYIGRWELHEFKNLANWPLHLCNTAMFLTPLCLVFKMKRLFNFCLFINVLGAFFAMLMPHALVEWSIVGTERVSYWVNHYAAFAMPLLIGSLNIFKRPKFRQFIYAVIALTAYFGLTLFLNAYLTQKTGNVSDFFFTNSDFIVSKLGLWAERTRDFTISFNFRGYDLTFYPIYQSIFLASYILLAVGVWFLYAILFSAIDKDEDRYRRERSYRKMKKDLKKYLGGKPDTASISGSDAPSLVIKNFSKRYGKNKHYSVNNVSFEVKGGEIFGFLGPNGAGKSTIIKSIVGIQTITSGNIEICGYDVEKQPVAAKMNTAFVPDHYALYENLTGREYINYIADLFEVSKKDREEFINKYVDLFQLTGAFDNQMKTYSHGMKQKITIMSALVHNPKVWILDEPLTGLDPTSIHEVKECMKEHAAKGNIVFFSSHIIDVVEKLCDKIAIIKKGQLRAYKSMQELNEEGIELERYYLDIIYDGNDEHVPYTEPEAGAEAVEENA
ncbi:MAG: ATP-binding cassette domain-containing protein [Ruminococcaceae bacterium]|nr:ATP-binding cassette domain-containing protein [Oscillospiraceae bacterium]